MENISPNRKGIATHITKFNGALYVELLTCLCITNIEMLAKICTVIREIHIKMASKRLFDGIIKGINDKNTLFISF